ncbi:MAG: riboflavin kinase [Actinomycetota bacterium]|nr:riboflavin kinase [Actinomycetota bacterium]
MGAVVAGVVVHGDGRGRQLGYPTANVATEPGGEVPEDGVYSGWARLEDGSVHHAAISVGKRPTYYEDGAVLVEAHLLDFDGDLYDQRVELELGALVRLQLRFDSTERLVEQIRLDVADVRRLDDAPEALTDLAGQTEG